MNVMRRKNQALSNEACADVLLRNSAGVLTLTGACETDGYPYGVPVSYAYSGGRIIMHGARVGLKMTLLSQDDRASFCVIDRNALVPEELTTSYRSVICVGRVRKVEDEAHVREDLVALCDALAPGMDGRRDASLARSARRTCVLELTVDRMTGKESMDLVRERAGLDA